MNKKKGRASVKNVSRKAAPRTRGTARTGSAAGVAPLGDRVRLKPLPAEEAGRATSFGIIIPETVDKEKPEQGTVMAVGPGKRDESGRLQPVAVRVGDRVMFSKYGYDEVKVGGTEYYIVSESNILAVIN